MHNGEPIARPSRAALRNTIAIAIATIALLTTACGGGGSEPAEGGADEFAPYLAETRALVDRQYANDEPRHAAALGYVNETAGLITVIGSAAKQEFFARQAHLVMCTPDAFHDAFDTAARLLFRDRDARALYLEALKAIDTQVVEFPTDC